MPTRNGLIFAGMVGVLFTMIIWYGIFYDSKAGISEKREISGDAVSLTADAMIAAYRANRRAADRKFKGKVCEISGTVVRVEVNWLGAPVAIVRGDRVAGETLSFIFETWESERVGLVGAGEAVVVRGLCQGWEPRYGVRFRNSILVRRGE